MGVGWVLASGSDADVTRGGPLIEYERRIAAGELLEGDNFQVQILFLHTSVEMFKDLPKAKVCGNSDLLT